MSSPAGPGPASTPGPGPASTPGPDPTGLAMTATYPRSTVRSAGRPKAAARLDNKTAAEIQSRIRVAALDLNNALPQAVAHAGRPATRQAFEQATLLASELAFHTRAFNPSRWQIITTDRTDIGMLHVEHRPGEIYLSRIEISPDHQGHGIGTRLIRALARKAAQNGQDLVLDVLAVNHRAKALYQRLGMTEVARHGDGNIKITMRLASRACQ